jgi:hypothetical protein
MNKQDRKNWTDKTERLNSNRQLKRGDEVIDIDKHKGIVVKIIHGIDVEDHGTVYVWQSERTEYGGDNCEHYVEFGWQKCLRVIDEE